LRSAQPPAASRPTAARVQSPREVALRALLAGGSQRALEMALRESDLTARDRALLTQLVYGTLKMRRALDWSIAAYLKRPITQLSPELLWTLRLGAFQLLYLEKIPAHSAVDESVKLARRTGHAGTAAVANAVLRNGDADLVSFAALYLANPDLDERFRRGGPFNPPDRKTFYGGAAKGYTDYPAIGN